MEIQDIDILIDKYLSGQATAEEKTVLENWYESINGEEHFLSADQLAVLKKEIFQGVLTQAGAHKKYAHSPVERSLFSKIKWAAAVLFVGMGITFYTYKTTNQQQNHQFTAAVQNDIVPGGNKATLTLANGSTMNLDDAAEGKLASQGNMTVKKAADGLLTYKSDQKEKTAAVIYNTLTTPRGGQYMLLLADGTKVWLNAASALKYPTSFNAAQRNVELTGEAYFEVAKNPHQPFQVSSAGQTIEVLGTHFNVNAYPDEPHLETTLLEGRVKITHGDHTALLQPGQQAVVNHLNGPAAGDISIHSNISLEQVTAWKNGFFQFEDADIKTIMNQMSRWYAVEVEYEGKIPADHFKGKVSRQVNLSQAMKILATSGINFKIEGKKIIVK